MDSTFSFRIVNDVNLLNLWNDMSEHDFSPVLQCDDVDLALSMFNDILMHYFNRNCPKKQKTVSYKHKLNSWISPSIVNCIKKRQNLDILCKRGLIQRTIFKKDRNYVTSMIRAAKRSYYVRKFEESRNDMRKTWELINREINPGKPLNKESIKKIVEGNAEYVHDFDIARQLNAYFSNIGKQISESCSDINSNPSEWLRGNYCHSFVFQLSPPDVYKVLMSLKNKQCNVNSIPVRVYKYVAKIISPIFSILINKSVFNSVFPESLKLPRVVPLFKGCERCKMENYRPISVLSIVSKIFERVVYKQLYGYFENKKYFFLIRLDFDQAEALYIRALVYYKEFRPYPQLDQGKNVQGRAAKLGLTLTAHIFRIL